MPRRTGKHGNALRERMGNQLKSLREELDAAAAATRERQGYVPDKEVLFLGRLLLPSKGHDALKRLDQYLTDTTLPIQGYRWAFNMWA